jgi:hypothetical protein
MVILLLKEQSSRDGIGGPGKLCNQRIAANLESYPTINFYGFGKLIERCLNAAVCNRFIFLDQRSRADHICMEDNCQLSR